MLFLELPIKLFQKHSNNPTTHKGCIDFAGIITGITGRQKQREKYWHNRSKFEQNILNYLQWLCLKWNIATQNGKEQGSPSQMFVFNVATQTDKDQYTLIERTISAFGIHTTQLYN